MQTDTFFRWCSTATETEVIVCTAPIRCNSETIDYLLSQPTYQKSWYEVKGDVFGEDWVRVDSIIQDDAT